MTPYDAARGEPPAPLPDPPSAPADPLGPTTIHPMDAAALGLDRLGMVSPPAPPLQWPHDGAAPGAAARVAPGGAADVEQLREDVIEVLRTVYDPEIPVNIYEIGLIYDLQVDAAGRVAIRMTLTSPMCPVAESLPPEVQAKVAAIPGVTDAQVELVWDPPWHPGMMSEEARLLLNIF